VAGDDASCCSRRGTSELLEASQRGLCSMELVVCLFVS